MPCSSGRKNVPRIPYRRLKAGFSNCVWLCLFVTESSDWDWMKCTRCKRLLLEKPFYLSVVFFLRHLKITSDSEQPKVKGKMDHSVSLRWNKKFSMAASPKRRVFFWFCIRFMVIYLWVDFAFFRRAELKPACILLLLISKYFFTCPDLLPLQNQLYPSLQWKNHLCA